MTVLDYILDGIEAELALERELGVRSVECDRTLLATEAPPAPVVVSAPAPVVAPVPSPSPVVAPVPSAPARQLPPDDRVYDFVFLHDRALTPDGVTMMAKIVTAMGKTAETAPIVFTGVRPKAKVYVVLGGNALKKWFPGTPASPGQWLSLPDAPDVLVTYSPAYILRFGTVTPAVQKLKRDMWTSLKGVRQRFV